MSEQQINSLDRFRKKSSRLVLETYSHCEAPAGCGGVVLRWRNPHAALALSVYFYAPGRSMLYLDSRLIIHTSVDVPPGGHVFAIHLQNIDLTGGLFMFAAMHDPQRPRKSMPEGITENPWQLLSAADGSWRVLTEAPIEHDALWTAPRFDDSSWGQLSRVVPNPDVEWREPGAHQAHRCNLASAGFLALPAGTSGSGDVWIRRRFVIPAPETK